MTSTRKALQSVVARLAEVIDQLPTDPSQPRRFASLADIPEDVGRAAGKYIGYPCELARSPLSGTGWMIRVNHSTKRRQWIEHMDLYEDDLTDIEEVIGHE